MPEVRGGLTLRSAAQHAGVSENTMRQWAKKIPGTARQADGSYSIPKDSLMGYLASREAPTRGPRQGGSFREMEPQVSQSLDVGAQLLGQVQGERDRLSDALLEARQRIKDLELQNSQLVSTLDEGTRDFKNTILSLMHQFQIPQPKERATSLEKNSSLEDDVIDAEHEFSAAAIPVAPQKKPVKPKPKTATKKKAKASKTKSSLPKKKKK